MQETLKRPPVESRNHLARSRRQRAGGFCLKRCIERPTSALNNDPLAHLYALAEAGSFEAVEDQIKTEFYTDIAERAKEQHFYGQFEYRCTVDDLIASTGLSLRCVLEEGLEAAKSDGIAYGIARAEAIQSQLPIILEWANSSANTQLAFFSLAPSEQELDPEVAKKLYFKQDRKMSSNWVFEKTPDGIVMHAFSLDNHGLAIHRQSLASLGHEMTAEDSLSEVASAYYFKFGSGAAAVESLRRVHDNNLKSNDPLGQERCFGKIASSNLSANEMINSHPEGYDLYREATLASFEALKVGRVTRRFARLNQQLRLGYQGYEAPLGVLNKHLFQRLEKEDVADLIDYLRGKAIPHFIYGNRQVSLAESGAEAVSRNLTYDGACPTSDSRSPASVLATEKAKLETFLFGKPLLAERFSSRTCPCCLPEPKSGEVARAWKIEGVYGCDDCGHVVDICGGVVRQGNPKVRQRELKPAVKSSKAIPMKNKGKQKTNLF